MFLLTGMSVFCLFVSEIKLPDLNNCLKGWVMAKNQIIRFFQNFRS